MSKLYSLIINIQIFLNIICKGKRKRVNNGYHCYHRTVWFFWFFLLKNRPEPNKTGSVWTGSRFGPGCINKEYYFPVWLYFWVKTGPNRTVNTPTVNYLKFTSFWILHPKVSSKYKEYQGILYIKHMQSKYGLNYQIIWLHHCTYNFIQHAIVNLTLFLLFIGTNNYLIK